VTSSVNALMAGTFRPGAKTAKGFRRMWLERSLSYCELHAARIAGRLPAV
jgi:hypothetical protein